MCLPTGRYSQESFTHTLPMALGWGTTYYDGEEVNILRGVPLPVWTNEDCDQAYFQPITEVFLCAGYADGGRDACQGDSGGPLMLYDEEAQSWLLVCVSIPVNTSDRISLGLFSPFKDFWLTHMSPGFGAGE